MARFGARTGGRRKTVDTVLESPTNGIVDRHIYGQIWHHMWTRQGYPISLWSVEMATFFSKYIEGEYFYPIHFPPKRMKSHEKILRTLQHPEKPVSVCKIVSQCQRENLSLITGRRVNVTRQPRRSLISKVSPRLKMFQIWQR